MSYINWVIFQHQSSQSWITHVYLPQSVRHAINGCVCVHIWYKWLEEIKSGPVETMPHCWL